MTYIIPILTIIIYAIMFAFLFKKRIEQTIPISVIAIVLVVYIFGLFDNLKLGAIITGVMAIMQLAIILCILCKEKDYRKVINKIKNIITPGLIIYIALTVLFIILNKGRIFENYDEFNHWGKIIKNMFMYNSYGTNIESTIKFNEYPPFTAIFQYIFLCINNQYHEDIVITAQCILYLSIIIPITKNLRWDKKIIKNIILFVLVIICMPVIFYSNFYLEILVDGIMGVMFGVCIFYLYEKEENLTFKYVKIFTMLTMLFLTKTTGIALGIVAILLLIINTVRQRKKIDVKKDIKNIMIVIMALTIIILTWYIKIKGTPKRWNFKEYFTIKSENENITELFIENIFTNQKITDKKLTVFAVITVVTCISFYLAKNVKKHNKERYILHHINANCRYNIFGAITVDI